MTIHEFVLVGILLSSLVTGVVIFFLREESHRFGLGSTCWVPV